MSPSAETVGSLLRDPAPLYEQAFRRSDEAMGVTRLSDGIVVDANDAFARLLGLDLAQVIGRRTIDSGSGRRPHVGSSSCASSVARDPSGTSRS